MREFVFDSLDYQLDCLDDRVNEQSPNGYQCKETRKQNNKPIFYHYNSILEKQKQTHNLMNHNVVSSISIFWVVTFWTLFYVKSNYCISIVFNIPSNGLQHSWLHPHWEWFVNHLKFVHILILAQLLLLCCLCLHPTKNKNVLNIPNALYPGGFSNYTYTIVFHNFVVVLVGKIQ